ncbi:MAG: UDP-3-O-(3-hydroxymyristoyl)glucosamine N-acyltransferase [Desulfosarcina sp.]|nr:UDP-3-O-(3-hydroxymyristoyl)glucosamine N-acyltransferase [Desulfobacterales bacterium]
MSKTLADLAAIVEGRVSGKGQRLIRSAAPFEAAGPEAITLARNEKYLQRIDETKAGAVIVPADFDYPGFNLLKVDNPYAVFARIIGVLHPPARQAPGIHPTAVTGAHFQYGPDTAIGPLAVVGRKVTVGARACIHPGVVVGDDVTIGDDVNIHPNVTIMAGCRIGNRVTIQAGSVIGSDGFGYAPDGDRYHKIPHTGIVQIDDDVDIGAGNTIDRGTFGCTRIQHGVKTDNLVHIAHNVVVGPHSILVAQVGISGSATLGRHVVLAGQVGVTGHLHIGDYVMAGGKTGISKSVPDGRMISGAPEMPHKLWLKVQRIIPRLPQLRKKVAMLERRLKRLEADKDR